MSRSGHEMVDGDRVVRNPLDPLIVYLAGRFGGGGRASRELERFLRFAFVGVSGTVVDFGLLILLQLTLLPPVDGVGEPLSVNVRLATAIAFMAAVVNNFVWTRLWVYPDSRSRSVRRQLGQFTLISVVGGVARTVWVGETFFWIGRWLMPVAAVFIRQVRPEFVATASAEGKLGTIVSQSIAMVVVMLWNFFANRYWTYSDVD